MRRIAKALAAIGLALSAALAGSASAQWGPGPGVAAPPPPVFTLETRQEFFGPSGTDLRRWERRSFWQGTGAPTAVPGPIGPSPTEIRREQRRWLYRGMGRRY